MGQSGNSSNSQNNNNNSNFSISQGDYVVSSQGNAGSQQTRILSNSKGISGNNCSPNSNGPQTMIYESKETRRKSNTYEGG
jgi:hypothetical protein